MTQEEIIEMNKKMKDAQPIIEGAAKMTGKLLGVKGYDEKTAKVLNQHAIAGAFCGIIPFAGPFIQFGNLIYEMKRLNEATQICFEGNVAKSTLAGIIAFVVATVVSLILGFAVESFTVTGMIPGLILGFIGFAIEARVVGKVYVNLIKSFNNK